MNIDKFTGRKMAAVALLTLALTLAACGDDGDSPVLVIPTPAVTAVIPTTDAGQPTVDPSAIAPTPTLAGPQSTATLPAPPTVAPPLPTSNSGQPTAAPTASPIPAATATPVATFVPAADAGYRVAFVSADDTLNVRRRPDPDASVVAELLPGTAGIQVIDEGQSIRGGGFWLPVETAAGDGWVNSRFLTEDVSHEAFCGDTAVTDLLDRLKKAISKEDGKLMSDLIHPDRGLRLRLNWWNSEVVFAGEDVQTIFRAQKKYDWGTEDGSGNPIRGSFSDVVLPRLDSDLLAATDWRCDEGVFGPTAGQTLLPQGYEAVRFYSAHRPAPADQEFDWGTWLVGIEHWEGRYYVSYLVHYRWEI
ncbi:MAG: hypothetical protein KA586_04925 [Candidatus Promineofilum sp.]|nr:hypothetical protein [Promineifilum sp.]